MHILSGHSGSETTLDLVSDSQPPQECPPEAEPTFTERLAVPLWWWPLAFGVAILLAAEVHMGYPGVRAWLPYLVTVPLAGVVLWWMGRHRVVLRGGELQVGPARISLRYLGPIQVICPNAKRHALGPGLDPAAFVLHTGWVGPTLRITVTDPADPTPYWIFSVRRAEKLAELLRSCSNELPRNGPGPRRASM
ncbi:MAG TPA: DUF3093 domain-containing protein [Pseudonocardiaceae bacterium]